MIRKKSSVTCVTHTVLVFHFSIYAAASYFTLKSFVNKTKQPTNRHKQVVMVFIIMCIKSSMMKNNQNIEIR